ncbi:MAG: pyruvate kinase [Candidatus Nanohalarchaeota archaeon]|nr:MAG: pyruvate kinase [Candidatus Nanohaloarchaeota archaeon]
MRKTKIICTLGPASSDFKILKQMVDIGFDAVRLNFSHGDYDGHERLIKGINEVKKLVPRKPALLLDTQGPEIRTGKLKDDILLNAGDTFRFSVKDKFDHEFGTTINYKELIKYIKIKDRLLVDDGLLEFEVQEIHEDIIVCKVLNSGILGSNKTVNLPNIDVKMPSLTEKDIKDIDFGIIHNIDFIAVSFVKTRNDIIELKNYLKKKNKDIQVISKIEHKKAVENFDEILQVSDGIMVARGDLGVEIPYEQVPLIQEQIIRKCNIVGKPVIVATHLLNSMIENPRPTRAEVSDVSNAILSGADALMLSGETAKGKYPVESMKVLDKLCTETEKAIPCRLDEYGHEKTKTAKHIVSNAVALCANELNAKAIIAMTVTGVTAGLIGRYRINMPLFVFSPLKKIRDETKLQFGAFSYNLNIDGKTMGELIKTTISLLKGKKYLNPKDIVIITVALSGNLEPNNFVEVKIVE